jgi:hypothetical protein
MTAFAVSTSVARSQAIDIAFFNLQTAAARLGERPSDRADFTKQVVELRSKINRLQDITKDADAQNLALYAAVLKHHSDLLVQASLTPDPGQAAAIVSDISADLDLKIASSASLGVGPAFRGVIEVTVHTKRDGTEISGYMIHSNPIRWKDSDPMFSFPQLSSPSTYKIPPGIYEVVATRAGQTPLRRTVNIGLAGEDKVPVEIPVP